MEEEKYLPEEIESNERKLSLTRFFSIRNLAKLFFLLLFLNLIYIDVLLVEGSNKETIVQKFTNIISPPVAENKAAVVPDICPQSCLSQIQQAIVNKPNAVTPTLSPTALPLQNTNSSQAKEYYVPFGSGSGSSADWQDVPGLQASIDSSSYASIKSVVFEASLHVPDANQSASVRLYNATDNHPVWNSQLDFTGSTQSVFLTSQSISLDSGNKLYKVQMETQLQYTAVLDQSRLHITTK